MHSLSNKQLGILAVIVLVIGFLTIFLGAWPSNNKTASSSLTPPPITASEQQQLQQMPVFQYLVSYTSTGFQPSTLTIKKGDVVRFTNNSSGQLWVASIGQGSMQIYPGTSNCGGSAFDSCEALNPGDFWEFQFTESGTYDFQNNADTSKSGSVTVTVS